MAGFISEPEADRDPQTGSPAGVLVATGPDSQAGWIMKPLVCYVEPSIRSLPLPILY